MTTSIKTCFKCGAEKPLTEFYRHKQMTDGHLNKCKDCARADVAAHRLENIEEIRAYDRRRGSRQPDGYLPSYRRTYPKIAKAHRMVAYHVRVGNIARKPCEVCHTDRAVAHHDDYDRPLDVRWMCKAHYKQWHERNGKGLNHA